MFNLPPTDPCWCVPRFVSSKLAPHCSLWCTLNEPVGYAACGWLAGTCQCSQCGASHFPLRWCARVLFGYCVADRKLFSPSPRHPPTGVHPPGKGGAMPTLIRVVYHLLCAHREAYAAIVAASATYASPTILMANNVDSSLLPPPSPLTPRPPPHPLSHLPLMPPAPSYSGDRL